MWVKRLSDNRAVDEVKYEVHTRYSSSLIQTGGDRTVLFSIYRYYKDNNGEWQLCGDSSHITLETLMSDFVLIDSPIEKELTDLIEYKKQSQQRNLEFLDRFSFNDLVDIESDDESVANLDVLPIPSGEK